MDFFAASRSHPGLNAFSRLGRRFTICHSRVLTAEEADLVIARYVTSEKELLAERWQEDHAAGDCNRDALLEQVWRDDERRLYHIGGGFVALALIEQFAVRQLREKDTITLYTETLFAAGEDVETLAILIESYSMLPVEMRAVDLKRLGRTEGRFQNYQLVITRRRGR